MPFTVAYSFDTAFRAELVDLDAEQVKQARRSRDYLIGQIENIASNDATFPRLYGGYKPFGSFARSTKIRPLNDIDLLLPLNGKGTEAHHHQDYTYWLRLTTSTPSLSPYLDEFGYLNSTKILNKFKSSLLLTQNYKNTPIVRNFEAVVLNLKSYDWSFDIVPAFPIGDGAGGVDYYLMPDGKGEWKRTDPRRDDTAVTEANKRHNKLLLPIIRLIKYWNTYTHASPKIMQYYLETMIINGMKYEPTVPSIREGVAVSFSRLAAQAIATCADPKGLGPNLSDSESWDTRWKVSQAATEKAKYAEYALMYEREGNHAKAIYWWGQVFPNFPPYG